MTNKGSFELVPLDCPTCGAAVEAEAVDVVYYCVACRNGYTLDEEARTLVPLEVVFVSAAHVAAQRYAPFWVLDATVTIDERRAAGGRPAEWLLGFFQGEPSRSADGKGRSKGGSFVVPAFHTSLESTLELTRRYTEALPSLGEKLGEKLTGGCYGPEDARKLTHFAVIAAEVERRDTLQQFRYRIRFGEARLLGVPMVRDGEVWKDGLFGITTWKL